MQEPGEAPGAAAGVRTPGAAPVLGEEMAQGPVATSQYTGAPALPPGRAVELPGRGTTFVREVAGPPGAPVVVLLHGWSVNADLNWFSSYGPLGERYRVIALDHRGHGRGIRPPHGRVTLSDCADDVAALLDVLGVDRAVTVGYSMGGPIAQLFWKRHPERVAGLVLCATARHFRGGPTSELWYRSYGVLGRVAETFSGPARHVLERMVDRRIAPGPGVEWMRDELQQADPTGLLTAMASLGRFDSTEWIGGLDRPTACAITTHDLTVPPSRQRGLAAAIPGATVHLVHGPHNVCSTDPPRFIPAFLDACASVTERL